MHVCELFFPELCSTELFNLKDTDKSSSETCVLIHWPATKFMRMAERWTPVLVSRIES